MTTENGNYDVIAEANHILQQARLDNELAEAFAEEIRACYLEAMQQIYRKVERPLTQEEAVAVYNELVGIVTSAALWNAWKLGKLTLGFNGEELTFWPAL